MQSGTEWYRGVEGGFLKLGKDAEWYRVVQRSWRRILKAREVYKLKQPQPIERIKPYREVP